MPELPGWQRLPAERPPGGRISPAPTASPWRAIATGRAGRSISPSSSSPARARAASWSASARARSLRKGAGPGPANAPAPPGGRAERIASHGVVREVVSFYRVGGDRDGERRGGEAGDDEDAPARRPAARGRLPRLEPNRAPRSTISWRALGPIDAARRPRRRARTKPMCGIAGIFHPDVPKPVDPARVEAMADVARPSRARRQRRLDRARRRPRPSPPRRSSTSATPRAQPMLSPDGREVADRLQRRDLQFPRGARRARGARAIVFRTESDTEVILAAWRQWGPDCLARLNGMFAFALYDAAERFAVPRPRPARREAALLCRALRRRPDLRLRAQGPARPSAAAPDARARRRSTIISPYGYVPDDASIVEGVRKLPAGHYLHLRRGRPVPAPVHWWDVDFSNPVRTLDQGARGGDGRAAARGGPLAHGRRRAAGRLPLRRGRQLGGGRLHGRGEPRRGRDLLDRLRRRRP